MRSIHYTPTDVHQEASTKSALEMQEISAILENPSGLLWVDLNSRSTDHAAMLEQVFHLHQLAINDALYEKHLPKIDDWGPYLYVVLYAMSFPQDLNSDLETYRLDSFLTSKSLLTIHESSMPALEKVWTSALSDDQYLNFGAVYLLYRLADEIINSYSPVVDKIEDWIEILQDQVFSNPSKDTLENIINLKHHILKLQRTLGPQREVFYKLTHSDYRFIDQRSQVYFRDIDDHLQRLYQLSESLWEMASDLLYTFLSVVNNQMNQVIKVLTIIATLFLPLSCVVGFFGMNFFLPTQPITSLVGRLMFVFVLLFILIFPIVTLLVLRRIKWI